MDCAQVDRDLWRYVDRELSGRQMAELSAHLRDCGACRQLHESRSRELRVYRSVLAESPFGDEFVGRFRSRFLVETSGDGEEPLPALTPERLLAQRLTLVLILFIVPILTFVIVRRSSPDVTTLGSFRMASLAGQDLGGRGSRRNWANYRAEGGRHFEVVSGFQTYSLRPGTEFEVASAGVLAFDLGEPRESPRAKLVAYGPGFLVFPSGSDPARFRARLDAGKLYAEVESRGEGESFEIETPDAFVRVVGTQFTVEVFHGETRVSVDEGRVELVSRSTGETVFVDADKSYRILSEPEASPVVIASDEKPAPIRAERDVIESADAGTASPDSAHQETAHEEAAHEEAAHEEAGRGGTSVGDGSGQPVTSPPVIPVPVGPALDSPVGPDSDDVDEDEDPEL